MTTSWETEAAREASPWIVFLARMGYLAKAILYATVGILAAQAALGRGGRTTDLGGALRETARAPLGDVLLVVVAAGLIGYALWRLVDAVKDTEGKGGGAKGIARRIGSGFRGLMHGALGIAALKLATRSGGGGEQDPDELTARAMELPGGEWLIWLSAIFVLGYAAWQLYRGYAAKLGRQLDLGDLSGGMRSWIIGLCRAGIAARGVVFGLIGVLLVRTATRRNPEEAGGLRESLDMLAGMGRWPLVVVSLGLVAYALYELLNARYRRIRMD